MGLEELTQEEQPVMPQMANRARPIAGLMQMYQQYGYPTGPEEQPITQKRPRDYKAGISGLLDMGTDFIRRDSLMDNARNIGITQRNNMRRMQADDGASAEADFNRKLFLQNQRQLGQGTQARVRWIPTENNGSPVWELIDGVGNTVGYRPRDPRVDPTETVTGPDGTVQLLNKRTGGVVPTKARQGLPGEKPVDMEAATADASNMLASIDQLLAHPGLPGSVGAKGASFGFGALNTPVSGTSEAGFMSLLNQIQGKAFLEVFQSLKGAGAITEQEGAKATQALSRMNTALSEPEFREAATELKGVITQGLERKRRLSARQQGQPATAPQAPASAAPVQISDEAGYNALPPGTEYIDPNGVKRRKR